MKISMQDVAKMAGFQPVEPDISKLPKWAQEHIAALKRERDNAVIDLTRHLNSQQESNLWIERGPMQSPPWYLQSDRVTFGLSHSTVSVSLSGQSELRIYSSNGWLAVYPEVTNVIRVGITR